MAACGNIEVLNTSFKRVFNTTKDDDMAIYTDTSNQNIQIGCGANPIQSANVIMSSSNTIINTPTIEVNGHIIPSSNMAYDIGSSNNRFRDLYLSGNTIDMAGTKFTLDSSNNIIVADAASNLRRLVIDEIQVGEPTAEASALKIKKDESGVFKFYRRTNNGEDIPEAGFQSGVNLSNLNYIVTTPSGALATMPTIDVQNIQTASNTQILFGRVVFGAHNNVSLTSGTTLISTITHEIGDSNYMVFTFPDDSRIIQCSTCNYTNNSFQLALRNITGASIMNPALNFQVVRGDVSSTTQVVASPVNITNPSQTVIAYSSSNSTSKSITITGASDPANYPIIYSISSNNSNRFAFSNNNTQIVYTHVKASSNANVVIKARNAYVDDNTKLITYNVQEKHLGEILSGVSSYNTTVTSTTGGQMKSYSLPGFDQEVALSWGQGSSNGLGSSISSQTVTWSTTGSTRLRASSFVASFGSTVMNEAVLSPKTIFLNVQEYYIIPSSTSMGSVSIINNTATKDLSSYFTDTSGTSVTYSFTANPNSNASISGTTLSVAGNGKRNATYTVTVQLTNEYAYTTSSSLLVSETPLGSWSVGGNSAYFTFNQLTHVKSFIQINNFAQNTFINTIRLSGYGTFTVPNYTRISGTNTSVDSPHFMTGMDLMGDAGGGALYSMNITFVPTFTRYAGQPTYDQVFGFTYYPSGSFPSAGVSIKAFRIYSYWRGTSGTSSYGEMHFGTSSNQSSVNWVSTHLTSDLISDANIVIG